MQQNRFRLGLHTRPRLGSLQRSSDFLAGFKGLLKVREGEEGERKVREAGKGRDKKGRKVKRRKGKRGEGEGKGKGMEEKRKKVSA